MGIQMFAAISGKSFRNVQAHVKLLLNVSWAVGLTDSRAIRFVDLIQGSRCAPPNLAVGDASRSGDVRVFASSSERFISCQEFSFACSACAPHVSCAVSGVSVAPCSAVCSHERKPAQPKRLTLANLSNATMERSPCPAHIAT